MAKAWKCSSRCPFFPNPRRLRKKKITLFVQKQNKSKTRENLLVRNTNHRRKLPMRLQSRSTSTSTSTAMEATNEAKERSFYHQSRKNPTFTPPFSISKKRWKNGPQRNTTGELYGTSETRAWEGYQGSYMFQALRGVTILIQREPELEVGQIKTSGGDGRENVAPPCRLWRKRRGRRRGCVGRRSRGRSGKK